MLSGMRPFAATCYLLFLLAVIGCGGPATGVVSGKVTYAGKTLSNGQIVFVADDGRSGASAISDGAYSVPNAPVGPVKILVRSFAPGPKVVNPAEGAKGEKVTMPTGSFTKIPDHYSVAEKSGLTYTVTSGSQTHDLDLK